MVERDGGRLRMNEVARRIVHAGATGTFTFALSLLAEQDPATSLTLSIVVGGITFLAKLLIDFDDRLMDFERRMDGMHEWQVRQSQDHEAAQLLRAVDACGVSTKSVTDLLAKTALLRDDTGEVVLTFVEHEIARTADLVEELSKGKATYEDGEDQYWILGLTRVARRSIDAISTATVDGHGSGLSHGYWASDKGRRYLKLQADVIQSRGVAVRRLFVLEKTGDLTEPGFLAIFQSQAAVGIDVRTLHIGRIPEVLRSRLDVIIYDGTIVYELLPSPESGPQRGYLMTNLNARSEHVLDRRKTFEDLWALAEPHQVED
ncbi:hypothetical protein EDD29_7030 [Actinocorallia herbida]|uniref:Uncharacterized protein n=1 Tax=Actinocorallia herbida TaxID=58109 RepID=A0A3N1D743_9ACTN|nr:hypothetical protein [Actinocorallia herbida]ROO89340.1 hypothetical protein EDD29_7030 [Actinocorallia herbida]